MVQRRIPLTVYQPAKAGVHSFAILASFEAAARAVLISVFPIMMYRSLSDAEKVSEVYFYVGLMSLVFALFVPSLGKLIPRRWLYTIAVTSMIAGNLIGLFGYVEWMPTALLANTIALVVMTVCFNAYVMDYIERTSMSKNETLRLVYSGAAWATGPFLGVWLMQWDERAPFAVAIIACIGLLAVFWYLRLGNGKVITKAKRSAANPLGYIGRFFRQPALVAGWLFSVTRSIGWMIYIIYLPIYALENGLGEQMGGLCLSISNAFLFITPFMLRYVQKVPLRKSIAVGFFISGTLFLQATLVTVVSAGAPMAVVVILVTATVFLVLLDVVAGVPFLVSVKPSERTEMAAVYSTFRDVSGVAAPALARLVLIVSPVIGIFAAGSVLLFGAGVLAASLHPRLGKRKKQEA